MIQELKVQFIFDNYLNSGAYLFYKKTTHNIETNIALGKWDLSKENIILLPDLMSRE